MRKLDYTQVGALSYNGALWRHGQHHFSNKAMNLVSKIKRDDLYKKPMDARRTLSVYQA